MSTLQIAGTLPPSDLALEDSIIPNRYVLTRPPLTSPLSSGGCHLRSCRYRSAGYLILAAWASVAAVVMIISMCIRRIWVQPFSSRHLSALSDSESSDSTNCDDWMEVGEESVRSPAEGPSRFPLEISSVSSMKRQHTKPIASEETAHGKLRVGEQNVCHGTSSFPNAVKKARMEFIPPQPIHISKRVHCAAKSRPEDHAAAELLLKQMAEERSPPPPSRTIPKHGSQPLQYTSGKETERAVHYLKKVKLSGEDATEDVVVWLTGGPKESEDQEGESAKEVMAVVQTVDSRFIRGNNSNSPPVTGESSVSLEKEDAAEGPPEPVEEDLPTDSAARDAVLRGGSVAVELLAKLDTSVHPFFRLPHLIRGTSQARINRHFAALTTAGSRLLPRLLADVRCKLIQRTLHSTDVGCLVVLAERLMSHAYYYEDLQLPTVPSRLVVVLGKRFLVLDALLSVLEVLGEPAKGKWWTTLVNCMPLDVPILPRRKPESKQDSFTLDLIEKMASATATLKAGSRPSSVDVVHIKQMLFCSPLSYPFFKLPDFDAWRTDDKEFWSSTRPRK